jgi:membrane protease YdiL (CAAX protease family)
MRVTIVNRSMLKRVWNRLPAIVRAIIIGELVVSVGGIVPPLAIIVNLQTTPRVPWQILVTGLWLWLFWCYLRGGEWPRQTAESRKRDLRGGPLTARVWGWALLAGTFGIASTLALGFVTLRVAGVTREAFASPIKLSNYPIYTVICAIASISATAGVVEEAGFRGYMLSLIQRRHGWVVGILITGFMFFLDHHFSHAYATFAFLPFFLAISVVHGLLVKYSGSIRPSVVLHGIADFLVIPIMYGLVGSVSVTPISQTGFDTELAICLTLTLCFALAAVFPFRRLATISWRSKTDKQLNQSLLDSAS